MSALSAYLAKAAGAGVLRRADAAQALYWFRKAADQGNSNAQVHVGATYLDGIGVPRDYTLAMQWFRKAADQKNANAEYNIGSMYLKGRGVPKDHAQAIGWYRLAASQGLEVAKKRLSEIPAD